MSKTVIEYKDVAPGASEDAAYTSGFETDFSTLQLSDGAYVPPIITGEQNEFGLDGNFVALDSLTVPFWTEEMSGADCTFETSPSFEIQFDNQYTSVGVTILFSQETDNYCRKINAKWYQQETLKADVDFYPDATLYYCKQNVESFDRIVITLLETSLPYRYGKIERVMFGVERAFDMTEIRSAKITNQIHLISAEVPVSKLSWTLDSRENIDFIFQLKQQMRVWNDGRLIGVYYIDEHKRTARNLYTLDCHDAIGVLDGSTFPGGFYDGYSAMQMMSDIIGSDFEITYAEDVQDVALSGIIAPGKRRAALQQVLFAWGVCAATDGTTGIRVFLPGTEPVDIGKDRTYTGAAVSTSAIVTEVRVTSHAYTEDENGGVEIGGVKYRDNQEVYVVRNPNVTANDKQNVKEIAGATLVSPDIAETVAQRVYEFYAKRNTASAKIVWDSEILGDCLTLTNAWDDKHTGNASKMEIILSNTVAAKCEVLA